MASLFGNSSKATTPRFTRRERESKTVAAMIGMYCRGHHRSSSTAPCLRCARLSDYAARRLGSCVFGDDKPTCAKCTVHCYSADRREEIRFVMQWAGPRMLLKHPMLAIYHLLAGRRPAPSLPGGKADRHAPGAAPRHAAKR